MDLEEMFDRRLPDIVYPYGEYDERVIGAARRAGYRMGFTTSRAEARQLIRHGHFTVNGRKASIPSMSLGEGAVVMVREKSRKVNRISGALDALEGKSLPQWLEIDKDNFTGKVKSLPAREDITMPIQEQLIVELYSGR